MSVMTNKPHEYACTSCGTRWISADPRCPNGCASLSKSDGEYTKKTLQGEDDLRKGGR